LLSSINVYAQDDNSVIVKIGNENITVKDFRLRIELSPYISANKTIDQHSDREFKNDFLYSLVAEKLWAKDAEALGFISSDKYKFYFKPLEDLFVRDALFKREVNDKVKLSAVDVNNGIQKSQFKLVTQVISTKDSGKIYSFFNQIKKNKNFDSTLTNFSEFDTSDVNVTSGSLKDEEIEDSLYSLKLNQFTLPIKSEIGWIIFRLKNKIFTPIDLNDKVTMDRMKKAIRERRIEIRYHEYMEELLAGTRIDINRESFLFVFRSLWDIIRGKPGDTDIIKVYSVNEFDFASIIKSSTQEDLNKPLFSIEKNNISVKDFLGDLSFNGFSVPRQDSILVFQKLEKRAKQFVENQIITKEGYKRKLNLAPDVVKDLSLWRQKYLAELYSKSILDSIYISDDELYDYYLNEIVNEKEYPLFNLRIVTLTELDEVSKIFDLLKEGKDFAEIVKQYGKTDPLVNENCETGLKPFPLLSDIGKLALSLKLNEVYGPIRRNDAYSIVQLFDKSKSSDSLQLSFESVKNELRSGLRIKIMTEKLEKITSNLAEKYNVKIYNDALDKIQFTKIPMFLHRFMGFGGRIAGVPLLTPFSGWMNNSVRKKLLP